MNAFLFVSDDLLLKSHYKTITVPGHVHGGKWVEPFQKKVLVSDDHNDLTVASGQGSFYQKQAHKKLAAELAHFAAIPDEDKAAIILHHATDMQASASASAALSGMKSVMLAGQVPKPAQIKALLAADKETHQKVTSQIKAKIGDAKFDELLAAAAGKVHNHKPTAVEPAAEPEKPIEAPQEKSKHLKELDGKYGMQILISASNDGMFAVAMMDKESGQVVGVTKFPTLAWAEAAAANMADGKQAGPDPEKSKPKPDAQSDLIEKAKQNGWTGDGVFLGKQGEDGGIIDKNEKYGFFVIPGNDALGPAFKDKWFPTMGEALAALDDAVRIEADPWHPSKLQDGDTKVEDGKTYQLRGGRWHLMGNKEANGHAATSKLDSLPWDKLLLADTNSNAKHNNAKVNAIKAAAYAGDVTALEAMKFGSNTYAKKQALLAQTAIAALKESAPVAPDPSAPIAAQAHPVAPEPVAPVAPAGDLSGKPAYDHLAQSIASKKSHTLPSQKTFHKMAAQDWMAANPDKGAEMYEALAAHKLSHLAAMVGPGVVPANKPDDLGGWSFDASNQGMSGAPTLDITAPNGDQIVVAKTDDGYQVINLGPGGDDATNYEDFASLDAASAQVAEYGAGPIPAAALAKLDPGYAAPVGQAFTKKKSIPVASTAFTNTQDGHNKFWEISTHGNTLKTVYGKIGTKGSSTEKVFANASELDIAKKKLLLAKLKGGYKPLGSGTPHVYSVEDASPAAAKPTVVTVSGPKEGDTKQGKNGDTLVLKNGHWCKLLKKGKLTPDEITDLKKESKIIGTPSVVAKTAIDAALTGDVAGLMTAYKMCLQKIDEGVQLPKTKKLILAIGKTMGLTPSELISGQASNFVTMGNGEYVGHGLAAGSAQPVPKAAPAAKVVQPKVKVATPKIKINAGKPPISVIDDWQQTGPQKGSNPGGKFKDKAGKDWYCKFPADVDVAMNELLAAKFYEMLGVSVPSLKLVEQGGKVGIASKWVDGIKKGSDAQLAKAPGAHAAFALDAWLANWDVVGLANDNLMLGKDGAAVRVDVGGSLVYRAQGGTKGSDFGDTVPELETLLDASKNGKSAAVFGGITPADMAWGLGQLNKMKPSQIEELCQKAGPGSDADKAALAKRLIARRAFILAKMGVRDQWAHVKALDPTKLPVNPADLPKPIDFANLNGPGKGLSSKAHVNAQNTLDSANMIAFASKGNLTALKNYQYDAVDKESGAALGKKPITDHPSSQIKSQWAGLIETLQSISTPPMETLKMPSLGAAGSEEEMSQLAGTFDPADRVETVATEHRMGFFMAVSHIDDIHDLISGYKWSYLTTGSKFVKDAKAGFSKLSGSVKAYISAVQSSGWINHIWSQGKATVDASGNGGKYSGGIQTLSSKIYKEALEIPDGTTLTRGMTDNTAGKSMTQQLLNATPGLVIQNTDSMCTSYKEGWSGFNGGVLLTIRCGKGCKGTPSFASGNFGSEHEITTLPGQRFVVLSVEKKGGTAHVELFMLPPHDGYIEQLGALAALGKAIVVFFKRGL